MTEFYVCLKKTKRRKGIMLNESKQDCSTLLIINSLHLAWLAHNAV